MFQNFVREISPFLQKHCLHIIVPNSTFESQLQTSQLLDAAFYQGLFRRSELVFWAPYSERFRLLKKPVILGCRQLMVSGFDFSIDNFSALNDDLLDWLHFGTEIKQLRVASLLFLDINFKIFLAPLIEVLHKLNFKSIIM